MDLDLQDWLEVDNVDDNPSKADTDASEDDDEDSTLRGGIDGAKEYDTGNLFDMTETDPDSNLVENKDSPGVVTTIPEGTVNIGTLSRHRETAGVHGEVIDRLVPDSRRRTNSGGAGHKGDELDDDEMEGLTRLKIAFEDLRSHMTTAWNDAMVWVEDDAVFNRNEHTHGGGQRSDRQSH